jgi:SAM-dependent methyltransferase
VGNKILSAFENLMLGTALSEFHSGYRAYSCHALKQIPFDKNTHDFHFDTQIIIQFHAAGLRVVERPIPTYYGDEICHVNGLKYARDVVKSVLEYELHQVGLGHRPEYEVLPTYSLKRSPLSSHSQLIELVGPPARVLDLGCGTGELGHILKTRGHYVVGIDTAPPRFELDEFLCADLESELPLAKDRRFDVVMLADVLEHLPNPRELLTAAVDHLAPEGRILVSLPNAVHWSVRGQLLRGSFEYSNKGILDRGHLRFFTRASAQRLFSDAGLEVVGERHTPVPWENVVPKALGKSVSNNLEKLDYFMARMRPNLFAYQHLFELRRATT